MEHSARQLTRHDPKRHRKAQRAGAEKGVRIYIAADELRAAGIDPNDPPPTFRVWARESGRGSLLVRLYPAG